MKRTLYIIRHGQTDLNKQGIVQGKGINSSLNEHGRQQAAAFYDYYKDVPFDRIITSSLKRTHQTVQAFIEDGVEWNQHPGLDEISWGIYEGKTHDEVLMADFNRMIECWTNGELDVCVEGGESPNEMKERQEAALKDVLEMTKNDSQVLICTHGRAMRMLMCLLTKQPYSAMDSFPHTNTALYKVIYDGKDFHIDEFYNTEHLDSLDESI